MTPRALFLPLMLGFAAAIPASVFAGPNANAKIQLHLMSPTIQQRCSRAMPACSGIVTNGGLYPQVYYAYLLVTDGDAGAGVSAVQFGLDYQGGVVDGFEDTPRPIAVFGYTVCAQLELGVPSPVFPNPGSSSLWINDEDTDCRRTEPDGPGTGVVSAFGYFYLSAYDPATMSVTPAYNRATNPAAMVHACEHDSHGPLLDQIEGPNVHHDPSHLGMIRFSASGTETGYSPCGLGVPALPTTWSGIKNHPALRLSRP
jgi:hypothetical protein